MLLKNTEKLVLATKHIPRAWFKLSRNIFLTLQFFSMKRVTTKRHFLRSKRNSLLAAAATLLLSSSCEEIIPYLPDEPEERSEIIQPEGPNPEWAPNIDPQMWAVVEQLGSYGTPPLPTLTADQAREAPTFRTAANDILRKFDISPELPNVDISQRVIPNGTNEGLLVRIYTPKEGSGPYPVIVYYHGGGWVIASVDTYESSATALAEKTGAIVVSVAYRQAPEHRFPAAHEDAFAAYQWARDSAQVIYGNPEKVATAGESAGGNLSVAVALMAKEAGVELPEHILSVYPIADGDVQSPTYDEYANAAPLNRPLMVWFFDLYVPDWRNETYPRISLVDADLSDFPSTTIINAEIDPLRAEGGDLADQLEMAGVKVTRKVYNRVTHEFFGLDAILEQAEHAQNLAAQELRAAFDK